MAISIKNNKGTLLIINVLKAWDRSRCFFPVWTNNGTFTVYPHEYDVCMYVGSRCLIGREWRKMQTLLSRVLRPRSNHPASTFSPQRLPPSSSNSRHAQKQTQKAWSALGHRASSVWMLLDWTWTGGKEAPLAQGITVPSEDLSKQMNRMQSRFLGDGVWSKTSNCCTKWLKSI